MLAKVTVSRMDPYAIKNMEFSMKKIKKYTTIKSILATITIFILTIILNINTLKHLWIPRSQLQISLTSKITQGRTKITSMPLCYITTQIGYVPQVTAWINDTLTNLSAIDQGQIQQIFPYMINFLNSTSNGSQYGCFNLEDVRSNITNFINITKNNQTDMYIRLLTHQQIIYFKPPLIQRLILYNNLVRLRKYIFYDRLSFNYQPQVIIGIDSQNIISSTSGSLDYTNPTIKFLAQNSVYDLKQYRVYRKNIGEIVGQFMAWYSILLLIFIIICAPMVEFSLNVQLVKARYTNNFLNSLEASMFVYAKYLLSFIFPKIIEENILKLGFQRLQKDMDIVNLLKKQIIMKRISKELCYSENKDGLFVPEFEQEKYNEKQLLQRDDVQQQIYFKRQSSLFDSQSQVSQKNCFISFLENILLSLDKSQVQIGLVYNNGKPYGSIWSIIIIILCIVGLTTFFLLDGMLQINTKIIQKNQYAQFNKTKNQMVIYPQQLVFVTSQASTGTAPYYSFFQILNQKFDVLQNLTMITNNTNCDNIAKSYNYTVNGMNFSYCLPRPLVLYNQKDQNYNYLRILFTNVINTKFDPGLFLNIFSKQVRFDNNFYVPITKAIIQSLTIGNLMIQEIQNIQHIDQNKKLISENYCKIGANLIKSISTGGVAFKLLPRVVKFQIEDSSLWDMVDSAWGITALCFNLIVIKLSVFINTRIKKKQTNSYRDTQRANIINILANHDRLINGHFKKQLDSIRYYFKENLSISDI